MMEYHFYLKDRLIKLWLFQLKYLAGIFSKTCKTVMSRKTTDSADKIWYFKQKLEFLKTCILHNKFNSFQTLKNVFNTISGDTKEYELLILCNKIYHYLED